MTSTDISTLYREFTNALADVLAAIQTVMPLIAGSAEEPAQQIAKVVVMAIAKGLVRHISIGY